MITCNASNSLPTCYKVKHIPIIPLSHDHVNNVQFGQRPYAPGGQA